MATVRYFTFVGGGSSKYWELTLDGSAVAIRYGRLGSAGQTKVKDLDSPASAAAHADKLVTEKIWKGYVESRPTPGAGPAGPAAPAVAGPAAPEAADPPGAPRDAGVQHWIERDAGDGRLVVVDVEPGFAIGSHDIFPEQRIEAVWVRGPDDSHWGPRERLPFGDLDPVAVSETVRDLEEVTR